MLKIGNPIQVDKASKIDEEANIALLLDEEDQRAIARHVTETFERDVDSRKEWLRRSENAIDYAMQKMDAKNSPFESCSNVKFPSLTIAAVQFAERASKAIFSNPELVRIEGPQELSAQTSAAAKLVNSFFKKREVRSAIESWLYNGAIVGASFTKIINEDGNVGVEQVFARNLVLDYQKPFDKCRRMTHQITLSRNEIQVNIDNGNFLPMTEEEIDSLFTDVNVGERRSESERAGVKMPAIVDYAPMIEQHCWLDLNCDGIEEPYIVLVSQASQKLVRIILRGFIHQDVATGKESVHEFRHFHHNEFLVSPDGGSYGAGLGTLLGPLTESINSLINQMIDAGTLANRSGGFLAAETTSLIGGNKQVNPFAWIPTNIPSAQLANAFVPFPIRSPQPITFQLLDLLIGYTSQITGATEVMTGVMPGQNTPAETSRNVMAQSQVILGSVYLRLCSSLQDLARNILSYQVYLRQGRDTVIDSITTIKHEDLLVAWQVVEAFDALKLNADADMLPAQARVARASQLLSLSQQIPGMNVQYAVTEMLRAMGYGDRIKDIYPNPDAPPPPSPQMQEMQMQMQEVQGKLQLKQAELQLKQQQHQSDAEIQQVKLEIEQLRAQAMAKKVEAEIVRLLSDAAESRSSADHKASMADSQMLNAQANIAKQHNEHVREVLKLVNDSFLGNKDDSSSNAN